VTGLRETVVRVVADVRSGAALADQAVPDAALAVIDTSSVEKGEGGWDEHVVTGLFRALTVAICTTYLRTCDDSRKTTLVEDGLRALLPISVLKTRAGGRETTADNLIAFVAMLLSAEPRHAARILRGHGTSQREKSHAPRRLRSLVRRIIDAHRPGGLMDTEEEPAEELLNGRDVSDEEQADSDAVMQDSDDVYHDSRSGDGGGGVSRRGRDGRGRSEQRRDHGGGGRENGSDFGGGRFDGRRADGADDRRARGVRGAAGLGADKGHLDGGVRDARRQRVARGQRVPGALVGDDDRDDAAVRRGDAYSGCDASIGRAQGARTRRVADYGQGGGHDERGGSRGGLDVRGCGEQRRGHGGGGGDNGGDNGGGRVDDRLADGADDGHARGVRGAAELGAGQGHLDGGVRDARRQRVARDQRVPGDLVGDDDRDDAAVRRGDEYSGCDASVGLAQGARTRRVADYGQGGGHDERGGSRGGLDVRGSGEQRRGHGGGGGDNGGDNGGGRVDDRLADGADDRHARGGRGAAELGADQGHLDGGVHARCQRVARDQRVLDALVGHGDRDDVGARRGDADGAGAVSVGGAAGRRVEDYDQGFGDEERAGARGGGDGRGRGEQRRGHVVGGAVNGGSCGGGDDAEDASAINSRRARGDRGVARVCADQEHLDEDGRDDRRQCVARDQLAPNARVVGCAPEDAAGRGSGTYGARVEGGAASQGAGNGGRDGPGRGEHQGSGGRSGRVSGGVDGRGGGGPPDGDCEGGDDHSDGGAGSPRAPTPEAGPGAARSTMGAMRAGDRLEERLDMAGFGLDFLSLGRLSRRGDALNSLDSADLNVIAGVAPVPPRPKFNAAEDCGGASGEARTNGPSPGTVVDGDAESSAAGVAAIRVVPRPGATAGDRAGDISAEREATLRRAPDRTDRDACGSLEASRLREGRPNVETGTLQRRPMDFHRILITFINTAPKLGLHDLIRSKLWHRCGLPVRTCSEWLHPRCAQFLAGLPSDSSGTKAGCAFKASHSYRLSSATRSVVAVLCTAA